MSPDECTIGFWSEIKLEIIREYAKAYSTILSKKGFYHAYIDGFAGPGTFTARETGESVDGSPVNALNVRPEFKEFHFIDLDGTRADQLASLSEGRSNVHIYTGDCNQVLPTDVLPKVRYEERRRALCLLDPYSINLHWSVIEKAARARSVEIFLNCMIFVMNRNVFHRDPGSVDQDWLRKMDLFWGDRSWWTVVYSSDQHLFGVEEKVADNDTIAEAYRQRLKSVAGFKYVPKPLPIHNSAGATLYYLFFASHQPVAAKIVDAIFNKHRTRRA